MAYGIGEQLEAHIDKTAPWNPKKPWKIQRTMWRRLYKRMKNRRERRRAKLDPSCEPEYKRYHGWEY